MKDPLELIAIAIMGAFWLAFGLTVFICAWKDPLVFLFTAIFYMD